MRKKKRVKKIQRRKNFFPSLIFTLVSWLLIAYLVYSVDPSSPFVITIFFILLFIALLFTFSIIFTNTRRGLTAAIVLTLFLSLRYYGVGNILNFILIVALTIASDIYFTSNNH